MLEHFITNSPRGYEHVEKIKSTAEGLNGLLKYDDEHITCSNFARLLQSPTE